MSEQSIPGLGPTPIVLREMRDGDREAVERLWYERFARVPGEVEKVFHKLNDDDFYIRGVVATRGTEVVGFGVAYPLDGGALEDHYYSGLLSGFPENAGLMHMGVVDEGYESKGIGKRLFQDRIDYLSRFRPASYIGTAWLRPDGHSSAALFEKYGFTCIAELPDYYGPDWECAACRPDDCGCSARIYAYPEDVAADIEVTADA